MPGPEVALAFGQLDGALDQPPIQVGLDQRLPKADQGPLAEGGALAVQALSHQLPAPIHHQRRQHLLVRDTGVGLQDGCQGKLGGWYRGLPFGTIREDGGELVLEGAIEQLMPNPAQEDEELGPADLGDDGLLLRGQGNRGIPG